jgi:hypothetical protein
MKRRREEAGLPYSPPSVLSTLCEQAITFLQAEKKVPDDIAGAIAHYAATFDPALEGAPLATICERVERALRPPGVARARPPSPPARPPLGVAAIGGGGEREREKGAEEEEEEEKEEGEK